MHRIVFFGLDGAFATTPLNALVSAELAPVLVVVGRERNSYHLRDTTLVRRARPGVWERMQSKLRPPDRPRPGPNDLTSVAHGFGIDVLDTNAANVPRSVSTIASVKPDAFVVAGFPHLLSRTLLDVPRVGGLNVHPGALPAERGPAPLFWALKEGRTKVTLTIHILDAGEDSGDVVATVDVPLEPGVTSGELLARLGQASAPLLVRSVRALLAGDIVRTPQAKGDFRRRRRPRFRDGKLDATRSAEEVYTFVTACADRYSLFAECGGDRFFVSRAVSYDLEASLDFEFVLTGDRLILRCEPGIVELELKEDGALFTAEYVGDHAPQLTD